MDPKQVAAELWNVIRDHLGSTSPQEAAMTMREIEAAITPVLMPSRRGGTIPAAQVADDLEDITRRLVLHENPNIDPIKMELLIKEVSSDMLSSLQSVWNGVDTGVQNARRSIKVQYGDEKVDDGKDEYADLQVKIKKSDLSAIVLDL